MEVLSSVLPFFEPFPVLLHHFWMKKTRTSCNIQDMVETLIYTVASLCSCSQFLFLTYQTMPIQIRCKMVQQVSVNLHVKNQLHGQQDFKTGARQGGSRLLCHLYAWGRYTFKPTSSFIVICQNKKKKSNDIKQKKICLHLFISNF